MKRSEHLEPLSHDHYEGLLVASRIRQGIDRHAPPDEMTAYVSHFWETYLTNHFRQEEDLLLPLLRAVDAASLAERMVEEHRRIRKLVDEARDRADGGTQTLADLARMMKAHIRFEERELFPTLEKRASEKALREVGAQLLAAHVDADLGWSPAFWT